MENKRQLLITFAVIRYLLRDRIEGKNKDNKEAANFYVRCHSFSAMVLVSVQYFSAGTGKKIPDRKHHVIGVGVQNENQCANLCSSEILIPGI